MKKIKSLIIFLIIFLFVAGCAFAFSFRNMTLDFINISDTHVSVNRDDTTYKALSSSTKLLADAIEQINAIKGLDFILFNGDLVDSSNEANWQAFWEILKKSKYPNLNSFGNHDFVGSLSKEETLNMVKEHNQNYIFDKTYYAFSPKTDYRIIILDSTIENENTTKGQLSQEQLDFLDNEINQNQDKIIIISMHHPSVEPFISKEHSLNNAKEFNEILLKYKNPIVVLSGHYHATKIRRIGNIVYVSTPSMVTYPMAFRHIKIVNYKDRVQYTFEFISTNLDDIKELNRQSVISYATLAGYEKDRVLSFTYNKKHPKSARYKRNKIKNASKETKTKKSEIKKLTSSPKEPKIKNKESKASKKIEKTKEPKIKEPKAPKIKVKKSKNMTS